MFLPRALSATTDAQNALGRLKKVFQADLREEDLFKVHPEQKSAIEVRSATWEWEIGGGVDGEGKAGKENNKKGEKRDVPKEKAHESDQTKYAAAPFRVKDINITIPRGSLVAIVGSVGSGKVRVGVLWVFSLFIGVCIVEFAARSHW